MLCPISEGACGGFRTRGVDPGRLHVDVADVRGRTRIDVGRYLRVPEKGFAARLQVDGLPDPARTRIPARLLSVRRFGVGDVVGADRDTHCFAGLGLFGEFDLKGRVAPHVVRPVSAVHPDRSFPINRTEDEEDAWAGVCGDGYLALVPRRALILGVFDAGQFALPGVGNVDGS